MGVIGVGQDTGFRNVSRFTQVRVGHYILALVAIAGHNRDEQAEAGGVNTLAYNCLLLRCP